MLLDQSEENIQHGTRHRDNDISGRLNHNTRQKKHDTEKQYNSTGHVNINSEG